MKKSIMILAIALFSSVSYAKSHGPKSDRKPTAELRLERATKELELSEEQIAQWELIIEKYSPLEEERSAKLEKREAVESGNSTSTFS